MSDATTRGEDLRRVMSALDRALTAYYDCPDDRDAHKLAAARYCEVEYDDVTPEQRETVKKLTFSMRHFGTALEDFREDAAQLLEVFAEAVIDKRLPWYQQRILEAGARAKIVNMPARHGMSLAITEHGFGYGRCDRQALAERLTGRAPSRPEMQRLPPLLGTEVTHCFMDELRPVTDVVGIDYEVIERRLLAHMQAAEPLTYRVSIETLLCAQ